MEEPSKNAPSPRDKVPVSRTPTPVRLAFYSTPLRLEIHTAGTDPDDTSQILARTTFHGRILVQRFLSARDLDVLSKCLETPALLGLSLVTRTNDPALYGALYALIPFSLWMSKLPADTTTPVFPHGTLEQYGVHTEDFAQQAARLGFTVDSPVLVPIRLGLVKRTQLHFPEDRNQEALDLLTGVLFPEDPAPEAPSGPDLPEHGSRGISTHRSSWTRPSQ